MIIYLILLYNVSFYDTLNKYISTNDTFINKRSTNMQDCFTVSFTGHRPQKLPWGYNEKDVRCLSFKNDLYSILQNAIQHNYYHFMSGMALGIDMISAELVLKLKKKNKNISLTCVIPCLYQEELWNMAQQKRYHKILKKADKIIYITNSPYTDGCMQKRNQYLIDHSNVVIGVWNGSKSGTSNTLHYAKKKGCKIRIIDINHYK